MNRGRVRSTFPDSFSSNGKQITDYKDIADGFNDFFANVGCNLAKKNRQV